MNIEPENKPIFRYGVSLICIFGLVQKFHFFSENELIFKIIKLKTRNYPKYKITFKNSSFYNNQRTKYKTSII